MCITPNTHLAVVLIFSLKLLSLKTKLDFSFQTVKYLTCSMTCCYKFDLCSNQKYNFTYFPQVFNRIVSPKFQK